MERACIPGYHQPEEVLQPYLVPQPHLRKRPAAHAVLCDRQRSRLRNQRMVKEPFQGGDTLVMILGSIQIYKIYKIYKSIQNIQNIQIYII